MCFLQISLNLFLKSRIKIKRTNFLYFVTFSRISLTNRLIFNTKHTFHFSFFAVKLHQHTHTAQVVLRGKVLLLGHWTLYLVRHVCVAVGDA